MDRESLLRCPHSPTPLPASAKDFGDQEAGGGGEGAKNYWPLTQGGGRCAPLPWAMFCGPYRAKSPLRVQHLQHPCVQ